MARKRTGLAAEMVKAGFDNARLAADMQFVIATRMLGLSAGLLPHAETVRMVAEKQAAFIEGSLGAATALALGKSPRQATKAALAPGTKRLRANKRRLGAKARRSK